MSEFTKGPWAVFDKPDNANSSWYNGITIFSEAYESRVADVTCLAPEYKANAHLIASAPDLLEALECVCEAVLNVHDGGSKSAKMHAMKKLYKETEKARSAISAAKDD